jgi:hypothetical protein
LWFTANAIAGSPPAPDTAVTARYQVVLEPSRLGRLAGHLQAAPAALRQDFAQIALEALHDSYLDELRASTRERPSSAAGRSKLARWQAATRDLGGQLTAASRLLAQGAQVEVRVDRTRQILLFIDATPVVISAPSPSAEKELERQVVDRFCALHACPALDTAVDPGPVTGTTASGTWLLQQKEPPVYEITTQFGCAFDSLDQRRRKASACARLRGEVLDLAATLDAARARGHATDWTLLRQRRPLGGDDAAVLLNTDGAYVRLSLPLLSRLTQADWERAVDWLQQRREGMTGRVIVRDTQQLF